MYTNGNKKKAATCKVKPYELILRGDDHRSCVQNCDPNSISNTYGIDGPDSTDTVDHDSTDNEENEDGTIEKIDNDVEKDTIGAVDMQMKSSVCFLENAVFVVEVPVWELN